MISVRTETELANRYDTLDQGNRIVRLLAVTPARKLVVRMDDITAHGEYMETDLYFDVDTQDEQAAIAAMLKDEFPYSTVTIS